MVSETFCDNDALRVTVLYHLFCVLAINSGFDAQDTIVKLLEEGSTLGEAVGLDISTGEAMKPADAGIFDNCNVKKQIINSW